MTTESRDPKTNPQKGDVFSKPSANSVWVVNKRYPRAVILRSGHNGRKFDCPLGSFIEWADETVEYLGVMSDG